MERIEMLGVVLWRRVDGGLPPDPGPPVWLVRGGIARRDPWSPLPGVRHVLYGRFERAYPLPGDLELPAGGDRVKRRIPLGRSGEGAAPAGGAASGTSSGTLWGASGVARGASWMERLTGQGRRLLRRLGWGS